MQRNLFFLFSFAIAAQLFTSCDGDKFSQVVEIDLPEHTPMLSVSAEMSEVDTLLKIYLTRTWPTVEQPDTIEVMDATVRLFKDGSLHREFEQDQLSRFYQAIGNAFDQDGATYRLEISAPDFETVFAEQKLPSIVELTDIKYSFQSGVTPDGNKADELSFEFQDPPTEEDYYGFTGSLVISGLDTFLMDSFHYSYDLYLESYDPLLESGANDMLLFSDASFNGKKVKFTTYCNCSNYGGQPGSKIVAQLTHITREKYLFLRSLQQFYNADGNPFAEPVNVQGNIEGGVGLFSLESVDTMQVGY